MSISIYRIEMSRLAKLSDADNDAIESYVYHADDGTYFMQQDTIDQLKGHISPELLQGLQEELDKHGDFNFIIS